MTRLNRRDVLRTAATVASTAATSMLFPFRVSPLCAASRDDDIDAALRASAAQVPGVVAMATTEKSIVHEGTQRRIASPARRDIPPYVVARGIEAGRP
jgi:hypothetical protein